jgi:hypothetical protein
MARRREVGIGPRVEESVDMVMGIGGGDGAAPAPQGRYLQGHNP